MTADVVVTVSVELGVDVLIEVGCEARLARRPADRSRDRPTVPEKPPLEATEIEYVVPAARGDGLGPGVAREREVRRRRR